MTTMTSVYFVKGMSCEHCVRAVSAEIAEIPGVTGVDVDLATAAVAVTSHRFLDDEAVWAAVVEAGYETAP